MPIIRRRILWRAALILGTVFYGMYAPLLHMCQVDGHLPFDPASVVLLIELLKLTFSGMMLLFTKDARHKFSIWNIREVVPFGVPAVLYAFNGNASVWMQAEMDPITFQVLGNLKIPATAFLHRIIMGRVLNNRQCLALGLLLVATTMNSLGSMQLSSQTIQQVTDASLHISTLGISMMVVYCLVSGFASVYNEYIMKAKYELPLHLQNIYQYTFGVVLNGSAWWLHQRHRMAMTAHGLIGDLLTGFSIYTWVIVGTQVFCGLLMSVILKHADNIARLFLICCSMLVTTAASAVLFDLRPPPGFYVDAALVVLALALYLDVVPADILKSRHRSGPLTAAYCSFGSSRCASAEGRLTPSYGIAV